MKVGENVVIIFCFSVFANEDIEVVYNGLIDRFPCISLDGNQCCLVLYYYESNAIIVKPIADFDDVSIFKAYKYKNRCDYLESKGFKIKVIIMDN